MKKILAVALASLVLALAACGGKKDEPQSIQAIPDNAADIRTEQIEVVKIADGLMSKTLLQGDGAVAEPGQTAVVHYTGWLFDAEAENNRGTKFDSSVDRGAHFRFPIGAGRVISGWDQGVVGMKVGEVRELTLAPEMAYGDRGAGGLIPPGATLIFVVELAGLEGAPTAAPAESK
jgi:FKBP-type peptidyl-prolyl cis-trans isomerase